MTKNPGVRVFAFLGGFTSNPSYMIIIAAMKFAVSRAFLLIVAFSAVSVASFSWCVYRDIQIEKQYPGDLRNRVVGSRMQMDGRSPYFYHFQNDKNLRYYDWNNNILGEHISNVTATPFFHQLISPVANLSQKTISKIWLFSEYLTLVLMAMMAISFSADGRQKMAILITGLLFLYSYAWTNHISVGQMYIFIAAEAMLYFYLLGLSKKILHGGLAGIVAAAIVLTRPTAIVFILSFVLVANQYSRRYLLTMGTAFLVTFALAFGTQKSRFFWNDYRHAMVEHVNFHRGVNPNPAHHDSLIIFPQLEGWNRATALEAASFKWYRNNSANGNVFVFLYHGLGFTTPVWLLGAMCIAFIVTLCALYFKLHGMPWHGGLFQSPTGAIDLYAASLLGFICYMATDLFSPIHRFHYNAMQWIFPLLLAASRWSAASGKLYGGIAITGLVLNSLPWVMFPMQQCIGEYIIMAAMIGFLLTYKPRIVT